MKKQHATITLWSMIEAMQQALERQGVDEASADATILHRLAASLGARARTPLVLCGAGQA